jgi:hypothetical protein
MSQRQYILGRRPHFKPEAQVNIFLLTITETMTVRVHFKDSRNDDKEITKSTPTEVQPSPVDKVALQLYLTSM